MVIKRERAIELGHRIAAMRQELPRLEAELDALLEGEKGARRRASKAPAPAKPETGTVNAVGSVVGPILAFLESHPGKSFSPPIVAQKIGASNLNSVRSALIRLAVQKRVDKPRRGRYAGKAKVAA